MGRRLASLNKLKGGVVATIGGFMGMFGKVASKVATGGR